MSEEIRSGVMKKYPYYKHSDVHASIIRKFYRHLGGQIALRLMNTRVTPNMLTLLSALFLFLAAVVIWFFGRDGYGYLVLAAVFVFLSLVVDKADGSLARMKKQGSSFGVWLDSISDNSYSSFIAL